MAKTRNQELLESMAKAGQSSGPYESWRISEKNPAYENAADLAECARQIRLAQAALTMNDPKGAHATIKTVQEALAKVAQNLGKKDKSAD